jgi:anaerobic selenocysteine-containing dehydrogenase
LRQLRYQLRPNGPPGPRPRGQDQLIAPKVFAHPDQVLHPLKRVGERDSGQWERVSWEYAMVDMIGFSAEEMHDYQYGTYKKDEENEYTVGESAIHAPVRRHHPERTLV